MVLAITRRELVGGGRAAKWYVLRGGFLLVLCLVTVPTVFAIAAEIERTPGFRAFSRGLHYTLFFGALEVAMVFLLAPAMSITAVAGEKASGVLELLRAAGVSPAQVVAGKLASRVSMLALFIASSLPLLMVGTLLGGAGAELVGLIVSVALGAAVFGTGLGLLVSGAVKHTIPALALAYGLGLALQLAPVIAGAVAEASLGTGAGDLALVVSPLFVMQTAAYGQIPGAPALAWLCPALLVAEGLVLAALAVPLARPSLERSRLDAAAQASLAVLESPLARPRARASRTVTGNPVAWREARSHRFGFGVRLMRLLYLSLGGAVAVHVLLFTVISGMRDLSRIAVALLTLAAASVTLVVASTSLASERETRALPLLVISRMGPSDIVTGKLEGLGLFLWPVAILPLIPALSFLAIDLRSFLLSASMTFVLLLGAAAVGLLFSAFARRPATAVWASIAATSAWTALVPYAIDTWCRNRCIGAANVVTLVNPIALVYELVSGLGRLSGEPRLFPSQAEPWVPYGGLLLVVLLTGACFSATTWRLARGGDA